MYRTHSLLRQTFVFAFVKSYYLDVEEKCLENKKVEILITSSNLWFNPSVALNLRQSVECLSQILMTRLALCDPASSQSHYL